MIRILYMICILMISMGRMEAVAENDPQKKVEKEDISNTKSESESTSTQQTTTAAATTEPITPVPEPSTWMIMGTLCAFVLYMKYRSKGKVSERN